MLSKTIYDARGNITEEGYFNTTGDLVNTIYNYARVKKTYDAYGSLTQDEYYDADGNRINCRDGYSIKKNIL